MPIAGPFSGSGKHPLLSRRFDFAQNPAKTRESTFGVTQEDE